MKTAGIISILSLLSPSFLSSASYFVEQYNPVPVSGDPFQLQMTTWGNFTDVSVYENNYQPVEGDEIGAFWTNLSDVDILVGVQVLNSDNESKGQYGFLDIYGDYGLASGLVNNETVFHRVYSQSRDAVYPAFPSLIFEGSDKPPVLVKKHDLAVPTPPASPTPLTTPTPTPTSTPTPTPATPTPTMTPTPEPPAGLILDARVFLQGPYTGSSTMNTTLRNNNYIPQTSPYADARYVASIPADAVDWVYIQLRAEPSGPAVSERSAFLNSDGYLMDDSGVETILMPLPGVSAGYYYIVVRHRDHLAIMSAGTHYLEASGSTVYDFTDAESKAYGTNPMKELATGVHGLFAGDADGSGEVDGTDYGLVFDESDRSGYRDTDVNLSGRVDSTDRSLTFNNRNRVSLAP